MTHSAGHQVPPPGAASEPGTGPLAPAELARLRLVVSRLHRQMVQASSAQDLTFAQLSALARIEQHGPLRLGELAALERVAAPSLTRTIAPLTAARLIGREPDPRDGRSCLVALTPSGRELLARVRRERSQLLAERVGHLGGEERATLRAAIGVLEALAAQADG